MKKTKADVARSNRKRGKRTQKKINENIGAKNVGLFGGQDGEHEVLSIEAKGRATFIGEGWMKQAETNCPKGKIPVVIIHVKGKKYETDDMVMLRIDNFKKLVEGGYTLEKIEDL